MNTYSKHMLARVLCAPWLALLLPPLWTAQVHAADPNIALKPPTLTQVGSEVATPIEDEFLVPLEQCEDLWGHCPIKSAADCRWKDFEQAYAAGWPGSCDTILTDAAGYDAVDRHMCRLGISPTEPLRMMLDGDIAPELQDGTCIAVRCGGDGEPACSERDSRFRATHALAHRDRVASAIGGYPPGDSWLGASLRWTSESAKRIQRWLFPALVCSG